MLCTPSQDNLVFVNPFLDRLQTMLESMQCLYCEKTFPSHAVLRAHMRKKKHFKISPRNRQWDTHYMVNFLELGKSWEAVELEKESEDDEAGCVCACLCIFLLCVHLSLAFHSPLLPSFPLCISLRSLLSFCSFRPPCNRQWDTHYMANVLELGNSCEGVELKYSEEDEAGCVCWGGGGRGGGIGGGGGFFFFGGWLGLGVGGPPPPPPRARARYSHPLSFSAFPSKRAHTPRERQ